MNSLLTQDVLIIGASASGLSTVEALRRRGNSGRITVVGEELHPPYDRPPLSKQVLSGAWTPDRSELRTAEHLASLDTEIVLGDPAVALDVAAHRVHTRSGMSIEAESIVIATGVQARRLPEQANLTGVHVLRTLDDALGLRADLVAGTRLVVVGEGVLGSEIAATAAQLGADVTLTGPQLAPMALQLGPLVSGLLGQLHAERGVELRLGESVTGLIGEGAVSGVALASGDVLPAEAVVVAIGSIPATSWLADSGLRLDNGVVCDSYCRAAEGIYAVGDVARWHHDHLDRLVRLENRTNATEQSAAVAATISGEPTPYVPVPYFWTDQFDVKVQVHGVITADSDLEVIEGDIDSRRFVVRHTVDGVTTGVVGWNMPKQTRLRRQDVVDAMANVATSH